MANKRRRHSSRGRNNYFRETMNLTGGLIGLGVVASIAPTLIKK